METKKLISFFKEALSSKIKSWCSNENQVKLVMRKTEHLRHVLQKPGQKGTGTINPKAGVDLILKLLYCVEQQTRITPYNMTPVSTAGKWANIPEKIPRKQMQQTYQITSPLLMFQHQHQKYLMSSRLPIW
ncbi:hypothetical protein O181_048778 [Austropuccinia psidii MF-1]|uniref:Uncharacterized protein n=1 Tax=Austropuccinia psidii MF-1 TaxID=1389203 RepID=A0A9Q3HKT1_9BASI|nr:hypothetical protein [Austropuccinia psidii MF-1]